MQRKGINYDVGAFTRGPHQPSSREPWDLAVVEREMAVIRHDLHCTAIRISGQSVERLTAAALLALEAGLEVWLSPSNIEATGAENLAYLRECAQAAEKLRADHGNIVFIVGCELTLFMKGLIAGETALDRLQTMFKPWRLIMSTIKHGSFHKRLNAFLKAAAAEIRTYFHGPLTYASGTWENVDWTPFDFVGLDYYRDKINRRFFRDKLRKIVAGASKPVIVTEFGCCTYQGASDKGGYGWAVIDQSSEPHQLKSGIVRDEEEQVTYMTELLDIFNEEKVAGAFWFTFVMPLYPYAEESAYNLDTASYSVVASLPEGTGRAYPGLPWEPKQAFHALAAYYGKS
ncbi:hypothetical protein ABE504_20190 [Paenibacillus oryzisoli]|uniref:hypothetical protein n=1 Tax=Paenibacillus oryzisoli TaxID=1850517 RepID=UPI003D2CDEA7